MVEICFPITFPARLWVRGYGGDPVLTEEGEAALHAVAQALEGSLRQGNGRAALKACAATYALDSWCTRWPGPTGDLVGVVGQDVES